MQVKIINTLSDARDCLIEKIRKIIRNYYIFNSNIIDEIKILLRNNV